MLALEDTPGHLKSPSQLAVHRLINWHEIYSRRVVVSIIFSKIRVWVLVLLTHYTTRGLSWADSMLNTTTRLTAAAGFQVLLLEFPLNITCGEGQEMIQSKYSFFFQTSPVGVDVTWTFLSLSKQENICMFFRQILWVLDGNPGWLLGTLPWLPVLDLGFFTSFLLRWLQKPWISPKI